MKHWLIPSNFILLYSLKGFGACTKVQRHKAVFSYSIGVGTVDQQQFGTLWLAIFTGLVQGSGAPRCQVYTGPTLQQELQAVREASPSCDVKRCGQLLLITQ